MAARFYFDVADEPTVAVDGVVRFIDGRQNPTGNLAVAVAKEPGEGNGRRFRIVLPVLIIPLEVELALLGRLLSLFLCRLWGVVKFGSIDPLQADGYAVFCVDDVPGNFAANAGTLKGLGDLEWSAGVRLEAKCVAADNDFDLGGVGIRLTIGPELRDGDAPP